MVDQHSNLGYYYALCGVAIMKKLLNKNRLGFLLFLISPLILINQFVTNPFLFTSYFGINFNSTNAWFIAVFLMFLTIYGLHLMGEKK